MPRPIPRNPNWRGGNGGPRIQARQRHHEQRRDVRYGSDMRILFGFIKIGLFILGAIAVVVLLGALLIQFIRATMPMSLIALAFMGFITWIIVKNS